MPDLYPNILATIGDTPVVRLNALAPAVSTLYAKLEAFNPMGSVKDRLALAVIEAAERDGSLRPGQTVVEASSGNTGIGLAMVCAVKGYPLVVVMAESFSVERRRLMRFLGAQVVLTPAAEKGTGMAAKARELAERHGWFLARQFENEANAEAHARTTAPRDPRGLRGPPPRRLRHRHRHRRHAERRRPRAEGRAAGGAGDRRRARQRRRSSPAASPRRARADGSPAASHPMFRPHLMQGWTPDFIPKLTAGRARRRPCRPGRRRERRARAAARPRARPARGHLLRPLGRRHARRRAARSPRRCRRAAPSSSWCPTPASATCRPRSSTTSPRR